MTSHYTNITMFLPEGYKAIVKVWGEDLVDKVLKTLADIDGPTLVGVIRSTKLSNADWIVDDENLQYNPGCAAVMSFNVCCPSICVISDKADVAQVCKSVHASGKGPLDINEWGVPKTDTSDAMKDILQSTLEDMNTSTTPIKRKASTKPATKARAVCNLLKRCNPYAY